METLRNLMKRSQPPHFARLLIFFAIMGGMLPLAGQSLEEVLFTVGTSVEDENGDGEAAVYLLWQANDLSQLKDRPLAVYSKVGNAASANPYQYDGIARVRLQGAAIQVLLARGEALGDDTATLENNLDNLFEKLIPAGGLPLEDKIAAVVAGALDDPEQFENLIFLSRRHPALSLILGTGFSNEYPTGVRTFELRACPDVIGSPDDDCRQVVGRVTIKVGAPDVLPRPGRPVEVPFTDDSGNVDPRAHLNVPLRWATPNDLRERSLLQFGFNVYRVEAELAEDDLGWDSTEPMPGVLADLSGVEGNGIDRVNGAPVLPEQLLTAAEAADTTADPETYFHIDDNDRFDPGGQPFNNGDRFYYFVAARDILGRIGEVSEGTEVVVCDRQPPPQAKRVRVENHYDFDPATDINTQHFRVTWEAPDLSDTQTPESITGYRVYRWWSIDEMHEKTPFPNEGATSTEGGLVAILPPSARSFIDDDPDAPYLSVERLDDGSTNVDQSYANKTFWYTVRTVDGSACGGNLGGNSAPAYGVLRDRIGPPKTQGRLFINCVDIRVVAPREVQLGKIFVEVPDPNDVYLTLQGIRKDSGIRWVEFARFNTKGDLVDSFGRHYFTGDQTLIQVQEIVEDAFNEEIYIAARMGNGRGEVSGWNTLNVFASQSESQAFQIDWEGETRQRRSEVGGDCDDHGTVPFPGAEAVGIDIEFDLTPTTEEWKVYRRIDDGELSMIEQGLDSALDVLSVIVTDSTLPASDSRICYFVQLFDEHGNPSPMVRVGCTSVEGKEPIPAPMLAPPEAVGTSASPNVALTWFCAPYGVERFIVEVTADNTDNLPGALGDDFPSAGTVYEEDGRFWIPFETRLANGLAPGNSPEFVATAEGVVSGVEYAFRVKAVGPSGRTSDYSNEETFTWNPDTDASVSGPEVPWPALGLPELSGFHDEILAKPVSIGGYNGAGVRVGKIRYASGERPDPAKTPWNFNFPREIDGVDGAESLLFTDPNGDPLVPFVLYRYQETNARYPQVSGDVYQVSPMMESIATVESGGIISNEDPFILVDPSADEPQGSGWYDLLVKDTQPMVRGARYRYLMVRYDATTREIVEVIPTNPIEIE